MHKCGGLKVRKVTMRKRRNGMWHSTGQGSGRVIPDGTGDEFDAGSDDDNGDDSDDLSPEDQVKKLKNEAKRRRLQVREARRERDELKAQLGENGQSTRPDTSEVVLNLVEAGMSRDRIRAAMKLVDWSKVDDVEDAIEDLREEHPFLFESSGQQQQDLPPQGGKGNIDKNLRAKGPDQRTLANKYTALRHARGRI